MRLLFDDLLEIYLRYRDKLYCDAALNGDDGDPYAGDGGAYGVDSEALNKLEDAIVEIVAPKSVGQAMTLPTRGLQIEGLIYLIKRDASDKYDDIAGYVEWVIENGEPTPAQYEFNGLDLCRWIDQNFPVEAVA